MSETSTHQIPGLKQKKVFKIIVLGDSGVGKTCLTYRFCEGQFLDKSEATIGVDFRERNIKIGHEDIKVRHIFMVISVSYFTTIISLIIGTSSRWLAII